jgi:hypothetical protein
MVLVIIGKEAVFCPSVAECYCNLYGPCDLQCKEDKCDGRYDMSCRNMRVCPRAGQESAGLGRRETLLVRTGAPRIYDAAGLLSGGLLHGRPELYCWLIGRLVPYRVRMICAQEARTSDNRRMHEQ